MSKTAAKKQFLTCTSKRKIESKEAATKFGQKHAMRTYKCPYCDGWHVTKLKKPTPTKDTKLRSKEATDE